MKDEFSSESDIENESKENQDNLGKEPLKLGHQKYGCPFCSQTRKSPSDMKRHIMIHTGEKPFACNFCDHKTSLKASLKTYIRLLHSKK